MPFSAKRDSIYRDLRSISSRGSYPGGKAQQPVPGIRREWRLTSGAVRLTDDLHAPSCDARMKNSTQRPQEGTATEEREKMELLEEETFDVGGASTRQQSGNYWSATGYASKEGLHLLLLLLRLLLLE